MSNVEDNWQSFSESFPAKFSESNSICDVNGFDFHDNSSGFGDERSEDMRELYQRLEDKVMSCFKFTSMESEEKSQQLSDFVCEYNNILEYNELWQHLTSNYGLIKPIDWGKSHTHKLFLPLLDLSQDSGINDKAESKLDDFEWRRKLDLHRLSESQECSRVASDIDYSENTAGEIVQTADEVIQEIEDILLNADEQDAVLDNELEEQTGIIINDRDDFALSPVENDISEGSSIMIGSTLGSTSDEEENIRMKNMKMMSVTELNEQLSSMEHVVKLLSEDLLNQLNLRDELLYVKEVRNTFISKVLEVQYRQEQFHQKSKVQNGRFRIKNFGMSTSSSTESPGRYLTTVIPFQDGALPTLEGIQALIRLLDAIKEDSEEVPTLITNYILGVLCPAPTGPHAFTL